MHDPIAETGAWLNQMLKGYLNYYAVSGNSPSLWWYRGAMALAQVAQAMQPARIHELGEVHQHHGPLPWLFKGGPEAHLDPLSFVAEALVCHTP